MRLVLSLSSWRCRCWSWRTKKQTNVQTEILCLTVRCSVWMQSHKNSMFYLYYLCKNVFVSAVMRSLRTQTHDWVWTVLVQVWFVMRFQFCSYCILIYIVNTSIWCTCALLRFGIVRYLHLFWLIFVKLVTAVLIISHLSQSRGTWCTELYFCASLGLTHVVSVMIYLCFHMNCWENTRIGWTGWEFTMCHSLLQ